MFFRHDGQHTVMEAHTGADGIAAFNRMRPDLVLLDVRLPDMTGFDVLAAIREHHPVVIMVTAYGDVPMAVDALHKGAENFLTKPVDLSHLKAAAERALEKAQLRRMTQLLHNKRGAQHGLVFGSSPSMRELQAQLQLLSASDRTTALILGESGAGKGRVAELLHAQSPRASKPFVEVNCASLRPESLDSELFGVEGATSRAPRPSWAPSRSPMAAPSFSTRSATSIPSCSPSSCACSRARASAASVVAMKSRRTCV